MLAGVLCEIEDVLPGIVARRETQAGVSLPAIEPVHCPLLGAVVAYCERFVVDARDDTAVPGARAAQPKYFDQAVQMHMV